MEGKYGKEKKIEYFEGPEEEEEHYKKAEERIKEVLDTMQMKNEYSRLDIGTLFEYTKRMLEAKYGQKEILNYLMKHGIDDDDAVRLIDTAITYRQLPKERRTYTYKK